MNIKKKEIIKQAAGKIDGMQDMLSYNHIYTIRPQNFYKALPYGFAFFDKHMGSKPAQTIWLPLAPQNINTVTHYATNIVTTLYGIVEEHSEVRYYDITISGTTGFVPYNIGAYAPKKSSYKETLSSGRKSFDDNASFSMGGVLPELTGTIEQLADTASELIGANKNRTGFGTHQTGYKAFHELYQFLLKYKREVSGNTKSSGLGKIKGKLSGFKDRNHHPLSFLNYKDGIKYDCIPISFTLVRSADNPMLYNYNIVLKAFNLRDVEAKFTEQIDLLTRLGLDGVGGSTFASINTKVQSVATSVAGIFG